MLDSTLRPLIDPGLNQLARVTSKLGITANQITVGGFVLGIITIPLLAMQHYQLALLLIMANRLLDGIDGALARQTFPTDLGAYLDIVFDFIFYSAVVFGFCLAQPDAALAGAFLIFSFIGSGSSFLAFAIIAEKRGISTESQGKKSIYYLSGIAEGFETILVLAAMCLMPMHFSTLAYLFGSICWVSTAARIALAVRAFR